MKIHELFTYDIKREITTVIKMDEPDEAEIAQELREYVVTPRIMECFAEFFEAYTTTRDVKRNPTDKIGVWIYGFFGSGKSHMAKVIGHLLRNPTVEGHPAIELFRTRITGLQREEELQGYLTQVGNFFDNHVVMLQIKAEQDLINPDSISEILYRRYLESRGFSRDPWIGRLELGLVREGVYETFKLKIQELENRAWEELRDDYLIVRSSIVQCLQAVQPERFKSESAADKALDDVRAGLTMGPSVLARELNEYLIEKQDSLGERSAHLVFIVDEIGQFVGDDDQKLLELQSIAEEFGIHGIGRLWLIVTAQEKLEDIIEGVKRVRAKYAKILDRFDVRPELTSENIEAVVEERILKKRPQGDETLCKLYQRHEGAIHLLGRIKDANRQLPMPDRDRFVKDYPFVPMHFSLMQDAFAKMRARGGASLQLTGSERSMIGVVQAVLKSPKTGFADALPGRLVTLDEIYDQIESEVPSYDRRSINEVSERLPDGSLPPIKTIKALFVLQQLDWLPCNLDNISRLLMPTVEMDYQSFQEKVKEVLTSLRDARYITEVDGIYKYLSVAERSIEEEIASEKAGNNDVRREARKLLREALSGLGRLNFESGLALFDIRILTDGEEIRSTGDITLDVYSPVGMIMAGHDPVTIRDVLSPGEDKIVYWLPGAVTDLIPDFKRLIRIEAAIGRRKGREQSKEEVVILREKETESGLLRERLKSALTRSLYTGQIIYQGNPTHLDGDTTNINTIYNRELSRVIPHVYTKFHLAKVRVSESSIEKMLTASSDGLREVESDLGLWDEQGHIRTHLPVVQEMLDELKRLREYGQVADGRTLASYFGGVPYGWNQALLRIVLAALFRAGIIAVQAGGTYYADPGSRLAKEALTKTTSFNKAIFDYDPESGLTLEQRKQAQHYLDILFDKKVDDTTNTLYRTMRAELTNLSVENERLRLQAQGVSLPLNELLEEGDARIKSLLEQQRPPQAIKVFLEEYEFFKGLITYANKLFEFIQKGHLETYRKAISLLQAVIKAQNLISELCSETVQKHIEDLQMLIEQCVVVERWGDQFSPAYNTLLKSYQATYAELYKCRTKKYRAIKEQIVRFGEVPKIVTDRIVTRPGNWSESGLAYKKESATISDLHYQIRDADQLRIEAIAMLEKKKPKKGKAKPVVMKYKNFLPSEVKPGEEAAFKKKAEKFVEEVEKELKAGKNVILS